MESTIFDCDVTRVVQVTAAFKGNTLDFDKAVLASGAADKQTALNGYIARIQGMHVCHIINVGSGGRLGGAGALIVDVARSRGRGVGSVEQDQFIACGHVAEDRKST